MMREKMMQGLVGFQIVIVLFIFFPVNSGMIPRAVLYGMDLVTGVLTVYSFREMIKQKESDIKKVQYYIAIFVLYTFLLFLCRFQSLLFYIWGLRNTFRFFLFFLACVYLLKKNMVTWLLKIMEISLYLNVLVCSVQLWILKMPYDNICGLFGSNTQGSGYMNVLLVIVTAYVTVRYLRKMFSLGHYLAAVGSCIYICVISELKAYYFELALIVFLALILIVYEKRRWNSRMLRAAVICVFGMAMIAAVTIALNPVYWKDFFSPQGIWEEITRTSGYSASGDLNRLTAIPDLFMNIFKGGWQSLIGYGLGNCDYARFDFLTTPFYQQYQHLHYVWIHAAFLFLELGFIGVLIYMGFFVLVGNMARKNQKTGNMDETETVYNQMAWIVSVCCFFLMWYNVSLRTEAAYMIFFVLSFPYMIRQNRRNGEKHDS